MNRGVIRNKIKVDFKSLSIQISIKSKNPQLRPIALTSNSSYLASTKNLLLLRKSPQKS